MISPIRVVGLTLLALCAFAANSVLCRLALTHTTIDPATFTTVRLVSGALVLWLIVVARGRREPDAPSPLRPAGDWISAGALFGYAIAFSFAYRGLTAGTGALLLFGAVQLSMISWGLRSGEKLHGRQVLGIACAFAGLVYLVLPGVAAPPITSAALMIVAGIAWGVYSLRGRGSKNPLRETAGNFVRATPGAVLLSLLLYSSAQLDPRGALFATLSGTIASGVGYAIWYSALPHLRTTSAATAQLSVPVIAALGGIAFLGETLTWRLAVAALVVIGGIALVLRK